MFVEEHQSNRESNQVALFTEQLMTGATISCAGVGPLRVDKTWSGLRSMSSRLGVW